MTERGFGFVSEVTRALAQRAAVAPLTQATAKTDAADAKFRGARAVHRGAEREVELAKQQAPAPPYHRKKLGQKPEDREENKRIASKEDKVVSTRRKEDLAWQGGEDAKSHSRSKRQQYKRVLKKLEFRRDTHLGHPAADPKDAIPPEQRNANQRMVAKRKAQEEINKPKTKPDAREYKK